MSKVCYICGAKTEDDNAIKCTSCGVTNMWARNEIEADLMIYSKDRTFLDAMMDLHEKDPIEYQLKLNQLKIQREQQKQLKDDLEKKKMEEKNQVHCPKCGSTAITTGARGTNGFWGFLGASKTVNRCGKCGYTWRP